MMGEYNICTTQQFTEHGGFEAAFSLTPFPSLHHRVSFPFQAVVCVVRVVCMVCVVYVVCVGCARAGIKMAR